MRVTEGAPPHAPTPTPAGPGTVFHGHFSVSQPQRPVQGDTGLVPPCVALPRAPAGPAGPAPGPAGPAPAAPVGHAPAPVGHAPAPDGHAPTLLPPAPATPAPPPRPPSCYCAVRGRPFWKTPGLPVGPLLRLHRSRPGPPSVLCTRRRRPPCSGLWTSPLVPPGLFPVGLGWQFPTRDVLETDDGSEPRGEGGEGEEEGQPGQAGGGRDAGVGGLQLPEARAGRRRHPQHPQGRVPSQNEAPVSRVQEEGGMPAPRQPPAPPSGCRSPGCRLPLGPPCLYLPESISLTLRIAWGCKGTPLRPGTCWGWARGQEAPGLTPGTGVPSHRQPWGLGGAGTRGCRTRELLGPPEVVLQPLPTPPPRVGGSRAPVPSPPRLL